MIALALAVAQPAAAWDAIGAIWPEPSEIPFAIADHLDGAVSDEDAVQAILASFDTWAAAGCGIGFVYEGRVDAEFGAPDGLNVVFFLEDWPMDAASPSDPVVYLRGDELVDVDIGLNMRDFAWSVDMADGVNILDVQGSVTHEIGHLVGLWHTFATDASVSSIQNGKIEARTLAPDDIEGLCSIYGQDPLAGVGDACVDSAGCEDGLACLVDAGDRYCVAPCGAGGTCDPGYECLPTEDVGQVCALAQPGCGCQGRGAAPVGGVALALACLASGRRRPASAARPARPGGAGRRSGA